MENIILFPFADYWLFYVGFTVFVLMMLALEDVYKRQQTNAFAIS